MKLNGNINNFGLSLLQPKLTDDTEEVVMFLDHPKKKKKMNGTTDLHICRPKIQYAIRQPNTVRLPHNLQ